MMTPTQTAAIEARIDFQNASDILSHLLDLDLSGIAQDAAAYDRGMSLPMITYGEVQVQSASNPWIGADGRLVDC